MGAVCAAQLHIRYKRASDTDENPNIVHLLEDEEKICGDIAEAKNDADIVIVFAHWGTEYAEEPDDFQKHWAQGFLDSGVDILIGMHPHVIQPYEVLTDDNGHNMLVYYSLGNFSALSRKNRVSRVEWRRLRCRSRRRDIALRSMILSHCPSLGKRESIWWILSNKASF